METQADELNNATARLVLKPRVNLAQPLGPVNLPQMTIRVFFHKVPSQPPTGRTGTSTPSPGAHRLSPSLNRKTSPRTGNNPPLGAYGGGAAASGDFPLRGRHPKNATFEGHVNCVAHRF